MQHTQCQTTPQPTPTQPNILPLPLGEGRGEGAPQFIILWRARYAVHIHQNSRWPIFSLGPRSEATPFQSESEALTVAQSHPALAGEFTIQQIQL